MSIYVKVFGFIHFEVEKIDLICDNRPNRMRQNSSDFAISTSGV